MVTKYIYFIRLLVLKTCPTVLKRLSTLKCIYLNKCNCKWKNVLKLLEFSKLVKLSTTLIFINRLTYYKRNKFPVNFTKINDKVRMIRTDFCCCLL